MERLQRRGRQASKIRAWLAHPVSRWPSRPNGGPYLPTVGVMTSRLRPLEAGCFALFRQVTGHEVTPYDVDGRQNAVDGVLTYPDGRTAAIEVTSDASQGRRQLDSVLAKDGFKWQCQSASRWIVSIDDPRDIPRARDVLQRVIDACEAAGVSRPSQLGWAVLAEDDDLQWAAESSVIFHGSGMLPPNVDAAGNTFAWIHPGSIGGWVADEPFVTFDNELSDLLAKAEVSRRVVKLARAQADECHLMIVAHMTAFSFSVIDSVMNGDALPPQQPSGLDARITHLWLVPEFGKRLLLWSPSGWQSHNVGSASS
jgi:hypothetical protein